MTAHAAGTRREGTDAEMDADTHTRRETRTEEEIERKT